MVCCSLFFFEVFFFLLFFFFSFLFLFFLFCTFWVWRFFSCVVFGAFSWQWGYLGQAHHHPYLYLKKKKGRTRTLPQNIHTTLGVVEIFKAIWKMIHQHLVGGRCFYLYTRERTAKLLLDIANHLRIFSRTLKSGCCFYLHEKLDILGTLLQSIVKQWSV